MTPTGGDHRDFDEHVLLFTKSGALPLPEIVGPIFDEINEKYGTNIEPTWK